jgi:UDP-N-acetylmuramyl pentapeptide synthase
MGDMRELGKDQRRLHIQAGRQIAQVCDALITVGELSGLAAKSARTCGFDAKNIFSCENSLQARDILFSKISPDEKDIVLVKGSRAMKMEEVLRI